DHGTNIYFEKAKKSIVDIERKIVVFIDDTDRLNKKEIFEVLRLIRNTANFTNVFFIVAYDREYITRTITELFQPNVYLEKIFQLEISLPVVNGNMPEKYLLELLGEIPNLNGQELQNILIPNPYLVQILRYCLKTFRDVTRLANNLNLNYVPISKEVL